MRFMTTDVMRQLCIKHNWFTSGDIHQYDKLMTMVKERESLDRIALVIWICTDSLDADITEEPEIYRELVNNSYKELKFVGITSDGCQVEDVMFLLGHYNKDNIKRHVREMGYKAFTINPGGTPIEC